MKKQKIENQKSKIEGQKYLTPEEAAKMLSIKTSLLSNWRVSGNGPCYVKLGSNGKRSLVRYPLLGDYGLNRYIEDRMQASTSQIISKKDAGKA